MRGRAEHPGDTSLPRVVVTMGLVLILVHLNIKNELSVLSYEDTHLTIYLENVAGLNVVRRHISVVRTVSMIHGMLL